MKTSDSDLHLLGFSDEHARPGWMILTVLPVLLPQFDRASQWTAVRCNAKMISLMSLVKLPRWQGLHQRMEE